MVNDKKQKKCRMCVFWIEDEGMYHCAFKGSYYKPMHTDDDCNEIDDYGEYYYLQMTTKGEDYEY